ncbi:MAG TPA: ferredoxin [Euryarchaeota archaeon]|nr:4Fe-4S binding domain protein [archaeon BMS3Bbin15]HDL15241.1 ferredoxin [Euryarchaeota archaeon]
MARPVVDQEACVGCGTCESMDPDCFEVVDDKSNVKCDDCATCDEIAEACPVQAITCE